jgi:replicative DNA helicase
MAGQGLPLAKHRNGPTGCVKLWLEKSQTRFVAFAAAEHYAEAV